MTSSAKRIVTIAALSLLSACASKGAFPSLNPRPIEAKAGGLLTEPDAQPAPLAPSNPQVTARIEAARSAASASLAAFDEAVAVARTSIAAAGAPQSESWIRAEMDLSAAERARTPVKTALADLDSILREQLLGAPSVDLEAVHLAITEVEAIDVRQQAMMQTLLDRLSR